MLPLNSSDDGVASLSGKTTHVGFIPQDHEVALITPGSPPAVLHKEVGSSLVSAEPNYQDTMIELLGGAHAITIHTPLVEVEGGAAGIHGNGDGSYGLGGLGQSLHISTLDILVTSHGGTNISFSESAELVVGLVRITFLSVDAIFLNVPKGVVHEATLATVVALKRRAVNQVLLAQGDQTASFQEVLSLQGAGCTEGPAGATLALVLDVGHCTLLPPVHLLLQHLASLLESVSGVATTHLVAIHHGHKLLSSQVTILVHAQSVAMLVHILVVVLDQFQVVLPDRIPLLLS